MTEPVDPNTIEDQHPEEEVVDSLRTDILSVKPPQTNVLSVKPPQTDVLSVKPPQ